MSIFATEPLRYSNVVKQELFPESAFCRATVVANEAAAKTYAVGTVLGKVTATGKFKIAVETAVDGSKVPAAIVVDDYTVAITTDTSVLGLVNGPAIVSRGGLVLDATYDNATKIATAIAALEVLGIKVIGTV
jgi:hypothetical protein